MAWVPSASLAGVISLEDISQASINLDPTFETPVLQLLTESKSKGYDVACIPLTNDNWRTRWKSMCLSPDSGEEKDENTDRISEAWRSNPVFFKGELNLTRLGD
jgi:protein arginine N-methyltransferase 5